MKSTEFEKAFDASRKTVGKQFGFKKCGYISYAVIDGYFFWIMYLSIYDTKISLKVKPFYADDLWYDIYLIPECKRPISLRGNGLAHYSAMKLPISRFFQEVGKISKLRILMKFGLLHLKKFKTL